MEANDTVAATKLLHYVVAHAYIEHTKKMDNIFQRFAYQNPLLVERVEKAMIELPGLKQTIEEEKSKSTANRVGGSD